jgi:TrpR family trp operon transcriptional repressor
MLIDVFSSFCNDVALPLQERCINMNQVGWRVFTQFCLKSNNETMLSSLFDLLLTQEEKESIAMRCLIVVELLKQEKTQRTIAEDLHVSIAKITRGSNELKRMPPKLIEFLKENM